jgi:hypothetical protein
VQIVGEHGLLWICADQVEEALLALEVDQLFVNAGPEVDYNLIIGAACRRGHDRLLYAHELAIAAGGHHQIGLGRHPTASAGDEHCGDQQGQDRPLPNQRWRCFQERQIEWNALSRKEGDRGRAGWDFSREYRRYGPIDTRGAELTTASGNQRQNHGCHKLMTYR